MATRAKNILYVDDEAEDTRLLAQAFRAERMRGCLHVVRDGADAIAWLAGEGEFEDRNTCPLPNLVLLEPALAGMDGLSVLRWIRSDSPFPTLPVVVFSGSCHDENVEEAYGLGATLFLAKPSPRGKLREIARFLRVWLQYRLPAPAEGRRWETGRSRLSRPALSTRFPVHRPMGART